MRNAFIIIGMLLSCHCHAQDTTSTKQLQAATTAGLNKLAYGITHTAIDSIDAAIPTLEEYMDLFRNRATRETASKAYDQWKVFSALCTAYAARNSYKVEELLEFVNEYYKNSEKPKFEDYFDVVEPALYYFSQRQNTTMFTRIAEDIYNEAVKYNEDSFVMMVCLYTKAMAAIAMGDNADAMTWLAKGYETGKKSEKEKRGNRLYKYYVALLTQMAQGYYFFSDFTDALSTIDEAQKCAETFYQKATQPYLTILSIKVDTYSRLGKQRETEQTINEIDSILKQPNSIDQSFIAYMNGMLTAYKKSHTSTDEQQAALNVSTVYNEALTAMNHCDGDVTVYGGIDYEESSHGLSAETTQHEANATDDGNATLQSDESFARRNRGAVANDLPGTLVKAQYIEKTFRKHGNNVTVYSAANASEESIKALSGKAPQILHIGTHGFFLYTDNDQKEHRNIIESFETIGNNQQNALLHCGLFFAGANMAWRGEHVTNGTENGILTAYELSQIDLRGCRLAVLSACETGLGLVEHYEGVFGLIKAMKLAGVDTIVASLWQVDDEVTTEIMTKFYNNIIAGKTPDEALATAKRDIIKTHPDPYYWAGFFVID